MTFNYSSVTPGIINIASRFSGSVLQLSKIGKWSSLKLVEGMPTSRRKVLFRLKSASKYVSFGILMYSTMN